MGKKEKFLLISPEVITINDDTWTSHVNLQHYKLTTEFLILHTDHTHTHTHTHTPRNSWSKPALSVLPTTASSQWHYHSHNCLRQRLGVILDDSVSFSPTIQSSPGPFYSNLQNIPPPISLPLHCHALAQTTFSCRLLNRVSSSPLISVLPHPLHPPYRTVIYFL